MKIVIADDDSITRQILRNMLSDEGHTVVAEAKNGQDVLPACETHHPTCFTLTSICP